MPFNELKKEWKFQIGPSVVTNIVDARDEKINQEIINAFKDKGLLPKLDATKTIAPEIFVRLIIQPKSLADELKKLMKTEKIECGYRLLNKGRLSEFHKAQLIRIVDNLMINILDVPRDALISVEIKTASKTWTSDYQGVDFLPIQMQRDE